MTVVADYPTFAGTREHLKDVLDATAQGRTVTVGRGKEVSAVMPLKKVRDYFFRTVSPRTKVFSEDGRVVAIMDGRPFASEGVTVDDAIGDLIESLREYAEDWEGHYQHATNHAQNWALVQLVNFSTDDQLNDWLERGGE